MNRKPAIAREQARRDIDAIVGFYLDENAPRAALGFINALAASYGTTSRNPGAGSPRLSRHGAALVVLDLDCRLKGVRRLRC